MVYDMLKKLLGVLCVFVGVVSFGLFASDVNADEMVFENVTTGQNFIDPELVGTKVEISNIGIQPRTGGYLYKNGKITSYTTISRKFVGTVTKKTKTWIKFTIEGKFSYGSAKLETGKEYSETKKAKQYSIKGTAKGTFGVYDKYSGNYMYSTNVTGTFTGKEEVAI